MGALKSKHCSKGHRLTIENTYIRQNGQRECRKCSLRRGRARRIAERIERTAKRLERLEAKRNYWPEKPLPR